MPSDVSAASDDLDRLFGDLVAAVSEGLDLDLDGIIAKHPERADEIAGMVALARRVAVRAPPTAPEVPGYESIEELGRGGMGMVWLMRQQNLDRLVALKTMSSRLVVGARARSRFEREARAVARLDHPNIVSIHEVGETDGTPWFTMDYVPGRSLAEALALLASSARDTTTLRGPDLAAAAHGTEASDVPAVWTGSWAETAARVGVDVGHALAHAHARSIVHRDVKPSNILLRKDGEALLFDFGLARSETEEALTVTGDFVGSPVYVAPELADANLGEIDQRTDVWALGVTLYEMLTQRLPFLGANTPEIFRAITETEPPPVRRFAPKTPRDLEVICLKALEKNPARRYQSAAEMVADLNRFLDREPILARPSGTGIRALRWVQRNVMLSVALFLGLALIIGAPLGFGIHKSSLLEQERRARNDLQVQLDNLEAVNDFQQGMFDDVRPGRKGRDVRVIDILESASAGAIRKLGEAPEVGLVLSNFLLVAYNGLGLTADALELAEHAAEVAWAHPEFDSELRWQTFWKFGRALLEAGQSPRALEEIGKALEAVIAVEGEDGPTATRMRTLLARALAANDHLDEAERLIRERIAVDAAQYGVGSGPELSSRSALSHYLVNSGRWEEAGEHLVTLERDLIALHGEGYPSLTDTRSTLAKVRSILGDSDEALRLYKQSLVDVEREHGPESIRTLRHLNELGMLQMRAGRTAAAESNLRDLCERARRTLGSEDSQTHTFLGQLGSCLAAAGKSEEACAILEEAVAGMKSTGLSDTRDGLALRQNMAMAWSNSGRAADAVDEMQAVTSGWNRVVGDNVRTAEAEAFLGAALSRAGRHQESLPPIVRAIAMAELVGDEFAALRFRVLRGFAETNLERLADAERTMLGCLADFDARVMPDHPERRRAARGLADVYDLLGRDADAAKWRAESE